MTIITIPKNLVKKDDLIIIPRKEYEGLLKRKKFYDELDRDLGEAIDSYKKGKAIGPFTSAASLKKSLNK